MTNSSNASTSALYWIYNCNVCSSDKHELDEVGFRYEITAYDCWIHHIGDNDIYMGLASISNSICGSHLANLDKIFNEK
jgi:hypothetical protein